MEPDVPVPVPCEEIPGLVGRFLAQGLPSRAGGRLRGHLEGCEGCRSLYREAVEATARLGQARREEREEAGGSVPRTRPRAIPGIAAGVRRRWWGGLRLLVYPAFFAFLMVQMGRVPGRGAAVQLTAVTGTVWAGTRTLQGPGEPTPLGQGQHCATGPAARARLEIRGAALELEGGTEVLVERPSRLRLIRGTLELTGHGRVATSLGVVDVDQGRARLILNAGGLELECRGGELRFTAPLGTWDLEAGQVLRAARLDGSVSVAPRSGPGGQAATGGEAR